ncbi:MAG TPA: glycosyltransferase [Acidimicrobiia bacterium]|nr:glycosyltransferase [Acidimicrobiia bacterium]
MPAPSIAFVSTYPPTVCGLASFTASLVDAIAHTRHSRDGLGVVAVGPGPTRSRTPDVAFHHTTGDPSSVKRAARVLNSYDSVSIQHEFGIFGGADGEEVVDLIAELDVPTAVTFHTVLESPSQHQRAIIRKLAERAQRMVVMSETASERLIRRYDVDADRIAVIPHGADARFSGPSLVTGDRPLVLTWGLIGPGKGLETVVEALTDLVHLDPRPRYLIAGATHPNVLAHAGEAYRDALVSLVHRRGLDEFVEFDDRYLDRDDLARLVRSADLVVLPYFSVEQVTSGVLVEAIAAGKPVVATQFPHAVELLAGGAGITVPHDDSGALSEAISRVLTDQQLRSQMRRDAQQLARGWYWPTIGRRFVTMMTEMAEANPFMTPRRASELTRVAG